MSQSACSQAREYLVGQTTAGMNNHGSTTSVHADQDVFDTPVRQLLEGRVPRRRGGRRLASEPPPTAAD